MREARRHGATLPADHLRCVPKPQPFYKRLNKYRNIILTCQKKRSESTEINQKRKLKTKEEIKVARPIFSNFSTLQKLKIVSQKVNYSALWPR